MKKLTRHQRQYRKRKKESRSTTKWIVRPDGKRVQVVANWQLCVRVNEYAAQRLTSLAEEKGITKGQLLTHMLLWGGYQVYEIISPNKLGLAETPYKEPSKGVKYKGSKGTKQLNLSISSTAWMKLDDYKNKTGLSKARIVQTIILYYTFQTPEQIEKRKEGEARRQREQEEWRNSLTPSSPEEIEAFWKEYDEMMERREREQVEATKAFLDSIVEATIDRNKQEDCLSHRNQEP